MRFLRKHHPSLSLPVPIDEIAEFSLKLGILPFPRLERTFGIDGFATVGRKAVVVDEDQMVRQPARFRFTLAHEIAHLELHGSLYDAANVTDLASYLKFHESLTQSEIDKLEFQARNLAGRILVPRDPLVPAAKESLKKLRPKLPAGFPLEATCSAIARDICEAFDVTRNVIEIRLHGDKLSKELGIGERT